MSADISQNVFIPKTDPTWNAASNNCGGDFKPQAVPTPVETTETTVSLEAKCEDGNQSNKALIEVATLKSVIAQLVSENQILQADLVASQAQVVKLEIENGQLKKKTSGIQRFDTQAVETTTVNSNPSLMASLYTPAHVTKKATPAPSPSPTPSKALPMSTTHRMPRRTPTKSSSSTKLSVTSQPTRTTTSPQWNSSTVAPTLPKARSLQSGTGSSKSPNSTYRSSSSSSSSVTPTTKYFLRTPTKLKTPSKTSSAPRSTTVDRADKASATATRTTTTTTTSSSPSVFPSASKKLPLDASADGSQLTVMTSTPTNPARQKSNIATPTVVTPPSNERSTSIPTYARQSSIPQGLAPGVSVRARQRYKSESDEGACTTQMNPTDLFDEIADFEAQEQLSVDDSDEASFANAEETLSFLLPSPSPSPMKLEVVGDEHALLGSTPSGSYQKTSRLESRRRTYTLRMSPQNPTVAKAISVEVSDNNKDIDDANKNDEDDGGDDDDGHRVDDLSEIEKDVDVDVIVPNMHLSMADGSPIQTQSTVISVAEYTAKVVNANTPIVTVTETPADDNTVDTPPQPSLNPTQQSCNAHKATDDDDDDVVVVGVVVDDDADDGDRRKTFLLAGESQYDLIMGGAEPSINNTPALTTTTNATTPTTNDENTTTTITSTSSSSSPPPEAPSLSPIPSASTKTTTATTTMNIPPIHVSDTVETIIPVQTTLDTTTVETPATHPTHNPPTTTHNTSITTHNTPTATHDATTTTHDTPTTTHNTHTTTHIPQTHQGPVTCGITTTTDETDTNVFTKLNDDDDDDEDEDSDEDGDELFDLGLVSPLLTMDGAADDSILSWLRSTTDNDA